MINNISIPVPTANAKWFLPSSGTPASSSLSGKDLLLSGPAKDDTADTEGVVEMELAPEGEPEMLKGTKAERRFMALNPHGTLDYYLPNSSGLINDYVDMITAHSSYWSEGSFAAFVLAEIFATNADYLRMGTLVHDVQVAETARRCHVYAARSSLAVHSRISFVNQIFRIVSVSHISAVLRPSRKRYSTVVTSLLGTPPREGCRYWYRRYKRKFP